MSNVIQTFFVNPAAVNGAEFVALTSINLYFKTKPQSGATSSGIISPGVGVQICSVVNDLPRPSQRFNGVARVEFANILPSSDAGTVTEFSFPNPIVVETGKFYGVVVQPDDPGFTLWTHVSGERTVGTNVSSANITDNRDGQFYQFTGSEPTIVVDSALKFAVDLAKFDTSSPTTLVLPNHGYEFLSFTGNIGAMVAGEKVFSNSANLAGTVSVNSASKTITGTGTTFTAIAEEQLIALKSGSTTIIAQIEYVISDTELTLFEVPSFSNTAAVFSTPAVGTVQRINYDTNQLILNKSNASPTNKFAIGQIATGESTGAVVELTALNNFDIDRVVGNLDVVVGGDSTYAPKYKTVKRINNAFVDDNIEQPLPNYVEVLTDETSILASRSVEVANTTIFNDGSFAAVISVDTTNPFAAPILDLNNSTVTLTSEVISDVYQATFANNVVYDSEVFNGGNAKNKHFTTKLVLSEGRVAEDLKVYLSAYRPRGTNLRVYAKFRSGSDQEAFDDKLWTFLTETGEQAGQFSSSVEKDDFVELEYSVPAAPESIETLLGSFTTSSASKLVSASSGYDPTAKLVAGDFVKVYNELFPTNFMVTTVESVNTTTVTLAEAVTLNGITGTGQKIDKLFYGRSAFTYEANDDVIRYLDESGGVHDGFVEAQLKIVLLGDPALRVSPKVDQLEMIGVSS